MRAVLLALLTAVALACAAAALAAGEPRKQLTAADNARAKAMQLTRADLGAGWTATRSTTPDDTDFRCAGYAPDESDLTLTGEAESPDLSLESQAAFAFVQSTASVYSTSAEGAASWRRTVKPGLLRCFTEILRKEVAKQPGLRFAVTSSRALPFARVAPRTAAYRISATVTSQGVPIPMVLDLVLLGNGRANGGFFVISALQPFPAAQEARLARTMAGRMAKALRSTG